REETAHAEKENKPIVKGKRYNILRNSENLKPEQREMLQELLDLNTNIHNAYILKEAFRLFWYYRYIKCVANFLIWWTGLVLETKLKPLLRFATGLMGNTRALLNILKFTGQ
ncbi:MAG: transposase, partial [Planctomycetaceae bacterium]|nr:transposase [Planctomycetaceae bacterium]